jgi:hypothetical protein
MSYNRRVRALALIVALGACGSDPPQVETVRATDHELPGWAPLPPPNITTANPKPWVDDGRPTLLLFSASWCASCYASLLTDVAIAQEYGDRFQIGIGLVENSDVEFSKSPMARLLADVPVWSADSVRKFATKCGAEAIPLACLVDRGRILYRGSADSARRLLDAYAKGQFVAATTAAAAARASFLVKLGSGVSAEDIPEMVAATHGDPGWQNRIAWELATRDNGSPADLALAVALARDVAAEEGGLDFLHLDTYQLALSKADFPDQAAAVSWRVLHLCKTVSADCMIEKRRAYAYIYYARERNKPRTRK